MDRYTKQNYPYFVCHHGNWDIYANDAGQCAAIPTDEARADGCQASYFGDRNYVRVLGIDRLPKDVYTKFTSKLID